MKKYELTQYEFVKVPVDHKPIQHIKYFVYILLHYDLDLIEKLSIICRPCLFGFF